MKVTLTKDVLVGPADVQATSAGTTVELDEDTAREFIANGLATEGGGEKKAAPKPENKMAPPAANKAK